MLPSAAVSGFANGVPPATIIKPDYLIPDHPLGREMMVRQGARQFFHLREVHSWPMDAEQAAKMAAKRPPALA